MSIETLQPGDAVIIDEGSIGNFYDENGNHWICFEHEVFGVVVHSYPVIKNGTSEETLYEVLVSGELYEMNLNSMFKIN